jgi:hypothetical protein
LKKEKKEKKKEKRKETRKRVVHIVSGRAVHFVSSGVLWFPLCLGSCL